MIFQKHYQPVLPLSSSNPRQRIVNLQAATTPKASCIVIRPAQSEADLIQVAQQRAEAYYEVCWFVPSTETTTPPTLNLFPTYLRPLTHHPSYLTE
jgi:hypothetical protein